MEETNSLAALLLIETIRLARSIYLPPLRLEDENYGEGTGKDDPADYRN